MLTVVTSTPASNPSSPQGGCRCQRKIAGGKSELPGENPELLPPEISTQLDIISGGPSGPGTLGGQSDDEQQGADASVSLSHSSPF